MPYLQLRITLEPTPAGASLKTQQPPRGWDAVMGLLTDFKRKWIPSDPSTEYTCGHETLNKYGEPCDHHFHFNCYFEQPDLKDPLRSAKEFLKRTAIARGFRLKGNKVWSCTLVEEPKDYRRWIRYPLKEGSYLPQSLCTFTGDFRDELIKEAQIERKRGIELNILKREKLADKSSFRDKLFDHLDDSLITDASPLPSHQTIWISILEFYQSQGKAICFKTVTGYTIGYQLHIKAITPLQCYVMRQNPQ